MVSDKKKKFVTNLTEQIKNSPVIALVDMQNLPAQQLQNMRSQLNQKHINIFMARKKLLTLSLTNSKKNNIEALINKIRGMPALLLSKENPFILYSILQKNKSIAPAKANQLAPKDIMVQAGATNFAPGPIISELANVGIKTKVDKGKLAIIQDTIVVKEGGVISQKLAEMLKRLDIKPMEIGLNLVAAWEEGLVFNAHQLHIDEAEFQNKLITAYQEAFNLSMEVVYFTKENMEPLLQKAFRESKALSLEQDIITDLTAGDILAKVERQALSIKESANLDIPEKKEQPVTKPHSSEEIVKATKEHFEAKKQPVSHSQHVPTAEELVAEERKSSGMDRRQSKEVKDAEKLFDNLKKQGTLRE